MTTRRAGICALVLALCSCAGSTLKLGTNAEGEVIDSVGSTLYDGAHPEETRRKALVDAMRNAVERVVGVQISAKTMVSKAVLIDSKILSRSRGYVRKYGVLRRWKEPPFYKTRIRALVAVRDVADDLKASGILEEPQVGNPRVAVLLTETVPGSNSAPSYASDALGGELRAKGFRVVDRADAKKLDAEILILGSVAGSLIKDKNLGGLISVRAALSAKAYKSQTNEILASVDQEAAGLDAAEAAAAMKAFALAGKQAGDALGPQLLDALKRAAYASVSVEGLRSIDDLKKIENSIASARGTGELYLRSYSGGSARVDVAIKGISTQELASAIEKTGGMMLKVRSVTGQTVSVAVQ